MRRFEVVGVYIVLRVIEPEYRIQRRHHAETYSVLRDRSNGGCRGDTGVINIISLLNDVVALKVSLVGNILVEEVALVNHAIFSRIGQNTGDIAVGIFLVERLASLPSD